MYHEGCVVFKHELVYQNISGLSDRSKFTGIEQVYFRSTLYPFTYTPWVESMRASDQII